MEAVEVEVRGRDEKNKNAAASSGMPTTTAASIAFTILALCLRADPRFRPSKRKSASLTPTLEEEERQLPISMAERESDYSSNGSNRRGIELFVFRRCKSRK